MAIGAISTATERMAEAAQPWYVPVSTYRLQFSAHLRFADAAALGGYLHRLGISAVYASPLFQARRDSAHGYDVIDHNTVDPEFGTEADFQHFAEELARNELGLVMDVVPNHMGIDDPNNVAWQDVLENGAGSAYAKFFDIEWHPPKETLQETILVPVLGDQYGRVLEDQQLQLGYLNQRFYVEYFQRRFPLAPDTWPVLLKCALTEVLADVPPDDPGRMELESIVTALEHLPARTEADPARQRERTREQEVARRRLATLLDANDRIAFATDATLKAFNGVKGQPRSFDRLEALLAEQSYRLCYWRVAADEINYRRFFDINELAALRVEDPDVFRTVHAMIFRFIAQHWVHGLRIDHPDGLLDPQQYLESLQEGCRAARTEAGHSTDLDRPTYVVVEKILGYDEEIPHTWNTQGTTGYDFLNQLNGIFVDRRSALAIKDLYTRFTGVTLRFADLYYESKKTILAVSMSSELHMLARHLDRISEQHRFSRDFTLASLMGALSEVIACFPVYRTYIRLDTPYVNDENRLRIRSALRAARRRNPGISDTLFAFIGSILLLEYPDGLSEEQKEERLKFVMRFQQLTGPVTAKGIEDTAFYRAYPLASLNEVGGEPQHFGISVEEFHRRNVARAAAWPLAMLASSTHDTKRSEGVRARINVLSEMPEAWGQAIERWTAWNRPHKSQIEGEEAPDKNEEYLLYQTLIGCWPLEPMSSDEHDEFVGRMVAYMIKAAKEAKLNTSWLNPEEEYDAAIERFVRASLERRDDNRFVADVAALSDTIAPVGMSNSLSQTLLKIASPGVPDFYQGSELWNFLLVDPDNRRPVDFRQRSQWLDELREWHARDPAGLLTDLVTHWRDGRIKLFLTWKALEFRRAHPDLFLTGSYLSLTSRGMPEEHVCALARVRDDQWAIALGPRLVLNLQQSSGKTVSADAWQGAQLILPDRSPSRWQSVLSGEVFEADEDDDQRTLNLAQMFARFPVALLSARA
jgi:(1->4)-alpha-D-glucan 1-alpha-D-glucosylmutase